jgi:hypothetical protein
MSQRITRGTRVVVRGANSELILELTTDQIEAAALDAFSDANQLLKTEAVREATTTKWPWPQGQSPRDVVSEPPGGGQLRSSITAEPEPGTGDAWLHTVGVDYAAPVLLGYRTQSATGQIRNWPARNIYQRPVERAFRTAFDAAYRRALVRIGPTGDA